MNNFTKIVSDKFLNIVTRFRMLENVDTVIVGFSGGADSVCLLHLLETHKNEFGYNIKAVHINHGIRGEEADRDQAFAENFCREFQIPFEAVFVNCLEESKNTKESLEECGRQLRYEAFNSFCDDNSKIATAHNSNDNAETVIFNVTRGTSVKGLCGIPFTRGNIIRPILDCSRNEIEGYCKENNLKFVIDSTNLSVDYTRNLIRHKILPVLEEINPAYLCAFSSLCNNAYSVSNFISDNADLLFEKANKGNNVFDRELLSNSHNALCSEVLFKAYYDFSGKTLDNKKIKSLQKLLLNTGRIQIYGNDFAEVKKDYIRFYKLGDLNAVDSVLINSIPFSADFNNYTVKLENFNKNSKIINQNSCCDMLDLNSVVGNLVLRTRKAGDEFTFIKRGVSKSLKKLFTEDNIPIEIRNEIPVISDDLGVVWVLGLGVTKRCVPTEHSGNIVLVRGENNDR